LRSDSTDRAIIEFVIRVLIRDLPFRSG
jgi:hypothetical protein